VRLDGSAPTERSRSAGEVRPAQPSQRGPNRLGPGLRSWDAESMATYLRNVKSAHERCISVTENPFGRFLEESVIANLGWPENVVKQMLWDHGETDHFLPDYGNLDLSRVAWRCESLPTELFQGIPYRRIRSRRNRGLREISGVLGRNKRGGCYRVMEPEWDLDHASAAYFTRSVRGRRGGLATH
jgi:hypothetical protein